MGGSSHRKHDCWAQFRWADITPAASNLSERLVSVSHLTSGVGGHDIWEECKSSKESRTPNLHLQPDICLCERVSVCRFLTYCRQSVLQTNNLWRGGGAGVVVQTVFDSLSLRCEGTQGWFHGRMHCSGKRGRQILNCETGLYSFQSNTEEIVDDSLSHHAANKTHQVWDFDYLWLLLKPQSLFYVFTFYMHFVKLRNSQY